MELSSPTRSNSLLPTHPPATLPEPSRNDNLITLPTQTPPPSPISNLLVPAKTEPSQTRSTRSTQSPYSITKLTGPCESSPTRSNSVKPVHEVSNYSELVDCSTEEFVLRYYKAYEFDSCVAELPSEGGLCGACGEEEGGKEVIVCDGCEGGFHAECVGVGGGEVDEWMCRDCEKKRKRRRKGKGGDLWCFGVKAKRRRKVHVPRGGGIR